MPTGVSLNYVEVFDSPRLFAQGLLPHLARKVLLPKPVEVEKEDEEKKEVIFMLLTGL